VRLSATFLRGCRGQIANGRRGGEVYGVLVGGGGGSTTRLAREAATGAPFTSPAVHALCRGRRNTADRPPRKKADRPPRKKEVRAFFGAPHENALRCEGIGNMARRSHLDPRLAF
jgi:hypothetical protein